MKEFVNSNGFMELFALAWSAFWVIVALHWAPWPIWTGKDLGPPWTYVVGVGNLIGHYVAWLLWTRPNAECATFGIILLMVSVGGGVLLAYLLDTAGAARRQGKFLDGQRSHID